MINGRYDFVFPLETCQEPLFRTPGSPAGDKKRILYDTGHRFGELPIMKAVDWFDHYPGQSTPASLIAFCGTATSSGSRFSQCGVDPELTFPLFFPYAPKYL
jgi:hypothetical protein